MAMQKCNVQPLHIVHASHRFVDWHGDVWPLKKWGCAVFMLHWCGHDVWCALDSRTVNCAHGKTGPTATSGVFFYGEDWCGAIG